MNEKLLELWPFLAPAFGAAVVALWSWFSNEVRSSDWYKRQPLWHRKMIDFFGVVIGRWIIHRFVIKKDVQLAVQPAVERLMSQADALKATHDGDILKDRLSALHESAVNAAVNKIVWEHPATDRAVDGKELVKMIDEAVPKAVEKAKKKRRGRGY